MAGKEPGSTPTSPASLQHTVRQLLLASVAPNTRTAYQSSLAKFSVFSRSFFPGNQVIPTNMQVLATYIAYLYTKGYAPSTITSQVSAIAFIHKLSNVPDPSESFLIKKLLAGARNLKSHPDIRKPIQQHTLHSLVDSVNHVESSSSSRATIVAMYLLLFHAFLRIGEIVSPVSSPNQVIQYQDVLFQCKDGHPASMVVSIHTFKHKKSAHPSSLSINSVQGPYCPVQALWDYCRLRGSRPGPLFTIPNGHPVTRSWFDTIFRRSLTWVGLDPRHFKSHSFRIGAATHAAILGASDAQIQAMGRWSSSAFRKYIRIPMLTVT